MAPIDGFCSSCSDQTILGLTWSHSGAAVRDDDWILVDKRIPAVRTDDGRSTEDVWGLPDELPLAILFEDPAFPRRVPHFRIGFHRGIKYLTVSSLLLSEWNVPRTVSMLGELKASLR
jgi:hypothetical protein